MNTFDRRRRNEDRFAYLCTSPVFWGVVLIVSGVAWLAPREFGIFIGPALLIGAGALLLLGPLGWYRDEAQDRDEEPVDW